MPIAPFVWLKRSLLAICLVPIACLVLGYLALQTGPGARLLASTLEDLVSSPGSEIKIDNLAITAALGAEIEGLQLSDQEGVWLTADNLQFGWSPLTALFGKIDISHVTADRIQLLREPIQPNASSDGPSASSGSSGSSLPTVVLRSLNITRFDVVDPITDTPISAAIQGRGTIASGLGEIGGRLEIDRLDQTGGRIDLGVVYAPAKDQLDVALSIREAAGGLAATLLDLPTRPAIDFSLTGGGPLSDWAADLTLLLDGAETLSGTARLGQELEGYRLQARINGEVAPLLPNVIAPLVAGTISFSADLRLAESGKVEIDELDLQAGSLMARAEGVFDPEGTHDLSAFMAIQSETGMPITLALSPMEIASLRSIGVEAVVRGPAHEAGWSLAARGLDLSGYGFDVADLSVSAFGDKANLAGDQWSTNLTLNTALALRSTLDPMFNPLTTGSTTLDLSGRFVGLGSLDVTDANLRTPVGGATFAGLIGFDEIDGQLTAHLQDLSKLAPLLGLPLVGSAELTAALDGSPRGSQFGADLGFVASNVGTGIESLDGLLVEQTSGHAKLSMASNSEVRVTDLSLESSAFALNADASFAGGRVETRLDGEIKDLAALNDKASGQLNIALVAEGALDGPEISLEAKSQTMALMDQLVEDFRLALSGTASASRPAATLSASGQVAGEQLVGEGRIETDAQGTRRLSGLDIRLGQSVITGEGAYPQKGTPTGYISFVSPNLKDLAPLLLMELGGALTAQAEITDDGRLTLKADIEDLAAEGTQVAAATLTSVVQDPFGQPVISGELSAREVLAGGQLIESAVATAENDGQTTTFNTTLTLSDGQASANGTFAPSGDGMEIALAAFDGRYRGIETRLTAPTRLLVAGSTLALSQASFALGEGSLTLGGSAGDQLDITGQANAVPVSLANAFAPGLGLGGALTGAIFAKGAASAPQVSWDMTWSGATASALSSAGLPSVNVASTGSLQGSTLSQKTQVSGPEGLSIDLTGPVNVQNLSLDLRANGQLPLALANRALVTSGLSASGLIQFDLSAQGPAISPNLGGGISLANASIVDLGSAIALNNINGRAELGGDTLRLGTITGTLASGGQVTLTGNLGLPPTRATLPADLRLTVTDGRYGDGRLIAAEFAANLGLTGELLAQSLLSGEVSLQNVEISIPDSLPGAIAPLAIGHKNAPETVNQQVSTLSGNSSSSNESGSTINLDMRVNAPGRIFVRGRGLDAELGGELSVKGTTSNPIIGGGFSLVRGRLNILNQRFDFDTGDVTFGGDLDPIINFAASTTTSDSTSVTIGLSGRASDPALSFSSVPSLPDEEMLARLLFDRAVDTLSPVQAAQMAGAVATLAGGGQGRGLFDKIRSNLGLSNLDTTTNADGETSVSTGTYIGDNIYLDVEQSTSGEGKASINLDIMKGLKARGGVDNKGRPNFGLFFEKEY